MYTSQILKISIYYLSKLSLVLVFLRLTPSKTKRRTLWIFILVLTLWSGAAVITHAVQCALPKPWNFSDPGCLNQVCRGAQDWEDHAEPFRRKFYIILTGVSTS